MLAGAEKLPCDLGTVRHLQQVIQLPLHPSIGRVPAHDYLTRPSRGGGNVVALTNVCQSESFGSEAAETCRLPTLRGSWHETLLGVSVLHSPRVEGRQRQARPLAPIQVDVPEMRVTMQRTGDTYKHLTTPCGCREHS